MSDVTVNGVERNVCMCGRYPGQEVFLRLKNRGDGAVVRLLSMRSDGGRASWDCEIVRGEFLIFPNYQQFLRLKCISEFYPIC